MVAIAGINAHMAWPPHQVAGLGFRGGYSWARIHLVLGVSGKVDSKLREYMLSEAGAVIADWAVPAPYVGEPYVSAGEFPRLFTLCPTPAEVGDGGYVFDATLKFR